MTARDGHYDAAGYCAICDHPTDGSHELCTPCRNTDVGDDDDDD